MKQTFKVFVAVLVLMSGLGYAQSYSVFGALSKPQGDFGDDSGSNAGLATTGFGVGFEYSKLMSPPNLYWVLSAALIRNGVDEDEFETDIEDYSMNVDAGVWYNIPIMVGLKMQTVMSDNAEIYGVGLVGYNFAKPPKLTVTITDEWLDEETEGELKYDWGGSFGYGIGGGIVFNQKYSVGFRYLSLGEPEFDGESEIYGEQSDEKLEQPISILLLTFGIIF